MPSPDLPLTFGISQLDSPFSAVGLDLELDEVRISNAARHRVTIVDGRVEANEFTPAARAQADDMTTALWNFDECTGQTAYSSPGNTRPANCWEALRLQARRQAIGLKRRCARHRMCDDDA